MPATEIVALVAGVIGCITSVVTVTPCVRLPLEECYGYLKDHEEKLRTLDKQNQKLKALLDVSSSLDNYNETAMEAHRMYSCIVLGVPEMESGPSTFLCGYLPNYYGRYQRGKNIAYFLRETNDLTIKLQRELHIVDDEFQNRGHFRITRKLVGLHTKVLLRDISFTIENGHWTSTGKKLVIGVCGTSGIGKTEVVAHVCNSLLKKQDFFDSLVWVEASSEDNVKKLQMKIASKIDLNLSSDDGVVENAALLMNTLNQKKYVLVLDNLRRAFSLEEIGIQPTRGTFHTVIITSQSFSVCSQMKSDKIVELKLLSDEEAYKLIKNEIRFDALAGLSEEVESILKIVAEECGGLPLAIRTVAAHLRKLNWNNHATLEGALKKELAAFREHAINLKYKEDQVFSNLLSDLMLGYGQLKYSNNSRIQACLLFCTLYPKNHAFLPKELIDYWMWSGLLGDVQGIDDKLGEAEEIFDELKDSCLLQGMDNEKGLELFKMHPFVWDKLVQTNKGSPHFFIGNGLTDSLYEDWPQDVERVSLMRNNLKELQSGPTFPKLSTLLLKYNPLDSQFSDAFFNNFPNLQLLDLSNTGVCALPKSLFELKKLNALLLRNCMDLTNLPSVAKLTELMVFDVSGSPITELPNGMHCLTKLLCLDISRTRVRSFPPGLQTKLFSLQQLLMIGCDFPWGSQSQTQADNAACIEDLKQFQNLSILEINFLDTQVFLNYITSEHWLRLRIQSFKFCVGGLYNGKLGNKCVAFMKEFPDPFRPPDKASELMLMHCNDVIHITIPNNDFGNVKILDVSYCAKLKCLFKQEDTIKLPNLEELVIAHCPDMKMITDTWRTELRRLQKLTLFNLPQLLSTGRGSGGMFCDSIQSLAVWQCSNLKNFPLYFFTTYRIQGASRLKEIKGEKSWFENLDLHQSKVIFLEKLFIEEPPPEELISRGKMMADFEPDI